MMLSLAWKELREGRTVWLALAVLGAGSAFVVPPVMEALEVVRPEQRHTVVLMTLTVLTVTYGLVCGALLLAGEREAQTLPFLDILSPRRANVWLGKFQVGAGLSLAQGLWMALFCAVVGWHDGQEGWETQGLFLAPLALDAMAWGLLGSAASRTVLGGAGLGAVLYTVSWLVTSILSVGWQDEEAGWMSRAAVDLLALGIAALIFCRPDRERRAQTRTPFRELPDPRPSHNHAQPKARPRGRSGFGWRAAAWLAWRQGRGDLLVIGGALLVLGLAFAPIMVSFWPAWTLAAGAAFGALVWGREQAGGNQRFLINQRLPVWQVWLAKTLFGLAAALLVVALGAAGAGVRLVGDHFKQLGKPGAWQFLGIDIVVMFDNPWPAALVWVAHGFAVGQLLGLLCQKNIVAVMLSLPLSAGLAALWLPSLVSGGLPVWQVFVAPALLVVVTRFLYWPWGTDRLTAARPVATLLGAAAVGLVFMAGCLWYRVAEVPDVGAPFDEAAFRERLTAAEMGDAGRLIKLGLEGLDASEGVRSGRIGPLVDVPLPPEGLEPPPSRRALEAVLRHGWGAAAPRLGERLNQMFKEDWTKNLEEGVSKPLGVVEDPRRVDTDLVPRNMAVCMQAGRLYVVRAAQLQTEGGSETALQHLLVPLDLSRHLRHLALRRVYQTGAAIERIALNGLERWMRELDDRPELAQLALRELTQHEAALPPAEVVQAEYLTAYRRYVNNLQTTAFGGEGPPNTGRELREQRDRLMLLALQTPWERARVRRTINLLYSRALRGGSSANWQGVSPRRRLVDDIAPINPALIERIKRQNLCRLRATRLQLALMLFEWEQGRPARELHELVPKYLPEQPADPFTNAPFGYRVSSGERILIDPSAVSNSMRLVSPPDQVFVPPQMSVAVGQGVLWSAGPDLVNNGGQVQGRKETLGNDPPPPGIDWIFLVPRRANP